jgi:radical SAM superfamily enzyme YgiQ (UPF0313 family)
MDRVLLLQPPSPPGIDVTRDYAGGFGVAIKVSRSDYGHGIFTLPYFSLMYSAGVLRAAGHNLAYLDAQAARMNADATVAEVARLQPSVIVSVMNLPSIAGDMWLLEQIKRMNPKSKIICIGTVCRVLPREIGKRASADYVVSGNPETVLPELIGAILDGGRLQGVHGVGMVNDEGIVTNGTAAGQLDLRKLPWPPYDIMPVHMYRGFEFGVKTRCMPVWASRGCSMPCSFYCPYPIGMGRTIKFREPDDIVREIAHLNTKHAVGGFIFRDQMFSFKMDRAEEICDLLIERGLDLQWLCETRFDMVSERLLRKMSRAGCKRIHFGLETGDPDLLKTVGKPGMNISTVREAIRLTKDAGIKPRTHVIIGLPGENEDSIGRTVNLLRELRIGDVSVNLATPYPGTPLFRYAKKRGLIETEDWSRFTSFEAIMRTETMATSELEEARRFVAASVKRARLLSTLVELCQNREIIETLASSVRSACGNPKAVLRLTKTVFPQGEYRISRPR